MKKSSKLPLHKQQITDIPQNQLSEYFLEKYNTSFNLSQLNGFRNHRKIGKTVNFLVHRSPTFVGNIRPLINTSDGTKRNLLTILQSHQKNLKQYSRTMPAQINGMMNIGVVEINDCDNCINIKNFLNDFNKLENCCAFLYITNDSGHATLMYVENKTSNLDQQKSLKIVNLDSIEKDFDKLYTFETSENIPLKHEPIRYPSKRQYSDGDCMLDADKLLHQISNYQPLEEDGSFANDCVDFYNFKTEQEINTDKMENKPNMSLPPIGMWDHFDFEAYPKLLDGLINRINQSHTQFDDRVQKYCRLISPQLQELLPQYYRYAALVIRPRLLRDIDKYNIQLSQMDTATNPTLFTSYQAEIDRISQKLTLMDKIESCKMDIMSSGKTFFKEHFDFDIKETNIFVRPLHQTYKTIASKR